VLIELNEAFASQAVYVAAHLKIPDEKLNVNGGAIALGHPLGCTGAKLTTHCSHEMKRRNVKYGIVTMCVGGGWEWLESSKGCDAMMEMKTYLLDTFQWNDKANRQVLAKIRTLPSQEECIKFFSHLINSQIKWDQAHRGLPKDPNLDWWKPLYKPDDLEPEWEKSLKAWLDLIESRAKPSCSRT
jgi:hypothetical protein